MFKNICDVSKILFSSSSSPFMLTLSTNPLFCKLPAVRRRRQGRLCRALAARRCLEQVHRVRGRREARRRRSGELVCQGSLAHTSFCNVSLFFFFYYPRLTHWLCFLIITHILSVFSSFSSFFLSFSFSFSFWLSASKTETRLVKFGPPELRGRSKVVREAYRMLSYPFHGSSPGVGKRSRAAAPAHLSFAAASGGRGAARSAGRGGRGGGSRGGRGGGVVLESC